MSEDTKSRLPIWLIVSLLANALLIGLIIGGGLGRGGSGSSAGGAGGAGEAETSEGQGARCAGCAGVDVDAAGAGFGEEAGDGGLVL